MVAPNWLEPALLYPGRLIALGIHLSQCGRNKKAKKYLNIAAWNVRTLIDQNDTGKLQRCTGLITSKLARYKIDIDALGETRLAGKEELTEKSSGYSFFWSGRAPDDKRKAGSGYAIKTSLVNKLACLLKGVNDCLMTMRLPLHHGKNPAIIISVYAPTIINTDETKDKFYEDFEYVISVVPTAGKFIILGDFISRVGQDIASWEGLLGIHGTGKCNSNGLLLLQTCARHNLLITNTVFRLPTRSKTSWMHPRSKQWHLIDYIIVKQKDRWDVRVAKAMCGTESWTDHHLISKLSIRVQPKTRPQGKKAPKQLNITKLKDIL